MEPIRINARLTLREHRSGIRYGTDALLLASFVRGRRNAKCADLGTGCGVIPLLLLASGRCGEARGFEVQTEYAALAAENARENGMEGRFSVTQGDIREIAALCPAGWADYVTANPPYLRADCGKRNADFVKYAAFRARGGISSRYRRCIFYRLPSGPALPPVDGSVRSGVGAEASASRGCGRPACALSRACRVCKGCGRGNGV